MFESIDFIPWCTLLGLEGIRRTIEMFEEIRSELIADEDLAQKILQQIDPEIENYSSH